MAILKSTLIGKDGKEPNWKEGNKIFTQALNEAITSGSINLGEVNRQMQEQSKTNIN